MNKRGQALIEFIIILPVLIFILLAIIDFGKIFYKQSTLENTLDEVVLMYKDNKTIEEITSFLNKNDKNIQIQITTTDYTKIILKYPMDIMTPGLNLILGKNYNVQVKRVIYNE